MSSPDCVDGASAVIDVITAALKTVFDPQCACPPVGGGSTTVRFMGGDGVVLEPDCESPFLWVRLAMRFRSEIFPDPSATLNPCYSQEVIHVEIGAARCATMTPETDWSVQAQEAEISFDDSWRLSRALCGIYATLKDSHRIGYDTVTPYGPEGGVTAWSSTIIVGL
ncbi:MAG: hypothetical protein JOY78_00220 [Pseudonocardia sp.]|nr:hypothetical protein [Pseudonocardia sp.]